MRLFLACMVVGIVPAFSQCPVADFDIQATACLDEIIKVDNNSINANNYTWSACPDNLMFPDAEIPLQMGDNIFRASYSLHNFSYQEEYYGIVIRNASLAYRFRYDFVGNTIDEIVDLNAANTNLPRDYQTMELDGNFWGFVTNSGGSNPTVVSFGPDLLNETPGYTALSLSPTIHNTNGLQLFKEGTGYALVGSDVTNEIYLLSFENGMDQDPVVSTFSVTDATGIQGISLVKECDTWKGILTSRDNSKLFRIVFSSGLGMAPNISEIPVTEPDFVNPAKVKIVRENGYYYAFAQMDAGNIIRMDFGNSLDNDPLLTSIQELSENGYGIEVDETPSGWRVMLVDYVNLTKGLYSLSFDNQCSLPTYNSFEPSLLSFSEPGDYSLRLVASNTEGDFAATSRNITIENKQAPLLNLNPGEQVCVNNPKSFSVSSDQSIASYLWSFGDSESSTDQNPDHTYTSTGNFDVSLEVVADNGCTNVANEQVTIFEQPIANFDIGTTLICSNDILDLQNNSTYDPDSPVSWLWDFNNEGSSTAEDPDFQFTTTGSKDVTLTVSLPGCESVISKSLNVAEGPDTDFNVGDVCFGEAAEFENLTTGENIESYHWDFGDMETSVEVNPAHTYEQTGAYQITLTSVNELGCETSATHEILVNELPVADFSNELLCSRSNVGFSDNSFVTGSNIESWIWRVNGEIRSEEQNPELFIEVEGDVQVQLTVTSSFGCSDIIEKTLTVLESPKADFESSVYCLNSPTQFKNISTAPEGGSINSVFWEIGNVSFTEDAVEYQFDQPGDHEIGLTVRADNLCSSAVTGTIQIEGIFSPEIFWSAQCENELVQLSHSDNSSVNNVSWSVGELFSSELSNPELVFPEPGSFKIDLEVNTESGCTYLATDQIQIFDQPQAGFSIFPPHGAYPLEVEFSNESVSSVSYEWFFDSNDNISSEENPQFVYENAGSYRPLLIALNDQGCRDSVRADIQVLEPHTDLHLQELIVNGTELIARLKNEGTTLIENPELALNMSNFLTIGETVPVLLYANGTGGDQINYVLNSELLKGNRLQFICLRASTGGDTNEENNEICINLTEGSVLQNPWPNPAQDFINFNFLQKEGEVISIELIDNSGRIVKSMIITEFDDNLRLFRIPVSDIESGIYILRVYTSGRSMIYRIAVK